MEAPLSPESVYSYIPSAVLILWSALFLFMYFHLKKSNYSLLVWGAAFAVFSVGPAVRFVVLLSPLLASCLSWLVRSAGAGLAIAGLFRAKGNEKARGLTMILYLCVTILVMAPLAFIRPPTVWLAGTFILQSVLLAVGTAVYALREKRVGEIPAYAALIVFAGTSAYCAYSLLAYGVIKGYAWIAVLNVLILCNTFSCVILVRAADSANTAKSMLMTLVENTTHGLAFMSGQGELLQVNGRMLEILGAEPSIGKEGVLSAGRIGLDEILSYCSSERKTDEIAVDFDELRARGCLVGRHGIAKLAVSVRKIEDAETRGAGTFIQIEDVTEIKDTLNELTEKRYSMDLMFKAAGACEYSREDGTLRSNSWFRALGYDFTSIDVDEFLKLVHPQERYKFDGRTASARPRLGGLFSAEIRVRNADGNYIWYFISSRNELIDGKIMTLGMAINIDIHKRMESYAMQNDRLAAVGQLANGVAHDINNYLMTIQTSLSMINASADEKQKQKFASYMQEALANSTGMLKRLVSFSKGDEVEYAPVSMNALLATTKELLRRSLGKSMKLKFACNSERDVILGNYYELQNIILNIGLNARDALTEADGEIAIQTWVSDRNPLKPGSCEWYCISMRDNGCGMSEEVQKRIFDPFFTTKPHGKGSGLGLFTAYGYIQRHGGTISVESVQGAGTEFVLSFPLINAKTAAFSGGENAPYAEPGQE